MLIRAFTLFLAMLAPFALAEEITIAQDNIEVFQKHFVPSTQPIDNPEVKRDLGNLYDRENWAVAQVILAPQVNPDVLVLVESCDETNLNKFNDRWLAKRFETIRILRTNTDRDQHLAILLKPGFKLLEVKDDYHNEPDTVPNDRGEKLFARGPGFCLVQSPSGYKFWVGVTHQKSKRGENVEQARWRIREAKRTHEIMKELQKRGPTDVMLLGDLNDEYGYNEYELEAGDDSVSTLLGSKDDGFYLVTKPLVDAGAISFGGYWRPLHRSLIDHAIVTPSMKDQIQKVYIYQDGVAPMASDHFPLVVKIKAD